MMTGKWTRMHGDCQQFNGIYKYLNRKSGESDADLDYRRKCDAAEEAYKAKKEKELGMLQCRELEFLMIDPSSLPPEKRAIIEMKQAEIIRKYPNANPNAAP
ncbi:hypothetical protein Tco_1378036 [Tanacetum coccineum]